MTSITQKNYSSPSDSSKKRLIGPVKIRPTDSMPSLPNTFSNRTITLKATMSSTRLETLRKENQTSLTNSSREPASRVLTSDKRDLQSALRERVDSERQSQIFGQRSMTQDKKGTEISRRLQDKNPRGSTKPKAFVVKPPNNSKKLSPLRSPEKAVWESVVLSKNDLDAGTGSKGDLEKGSIDYLKACTKKYMAAMKIVKAFETNVPGGSNLTRESHMGEENGTVNGEEGSMQNPLQQDFQSILLEIELAIVHRKNRSEVEGNLDAIVEAAQRTKNTEFYIAALRTQAKILFIYNNIYRAIAVLKAMKHQADLINSFTVKLKTYKYLGMCYLKVKNYKKAIFYNIKMLQAAWLCNSKRYELAAYDQIGMAYYYQGNLEKANYFHEKMMSGNVEPKDSKLRQLGINKLLNKMAEIHNSMKRNAKATKVAEELDEGNAPASEDEFDLPSPHHNHLGDLIPSRDGSRASSPPKKRKAMIILNKMMNSSAMSNRPKKSERLRTSTSTDKSKEFDSFTLLKSRKDIFNGTLSSQVLLSHLSPNRILNNFQPKDAQAIVAGACVSIGAESGDNYLVLDTKSLEQIRKKLEKLKENTQMALKRIIEIEEENKRRMRNAKDRRK